MSATATEAAGRLGAPSPDDGRVPPFADPAPASHGEPRHRRLLRRPPRSHIRSPDRQSRESPPRRSVAREQAHPPPSGSVYGRRPATSELRRAGTASQIAVPENAAVTERTVAVLAGGLSHEREVSL